MTVKELIEQLQDIEDKTKVVKFPIFVAGLSKATMNEIHGTAEGPDCVTLVW
jgi:hypothetical protein